MEFATNAGVVRFGPAPYIPGGQASQYNVGDIIARLEGPVSLVFRVEEGGFVFDAGSATVGTFDDLPDTELELALLLEMLALAVERGRLDAP